MGVRVERYLQSWNPGMMPERKDFFPVNPKSWQLSCETELSFMVQRDGGSVLRHKENSLISPVLRP